MVGRSLVPHCSVCACLTFARLLAAGAGENRVVGCAALIDCTGWAAAAPIENGVARMTDAIRTDFSMMISS